MKTRHHIGFLILLLIALGMAAWLSFLRILAFQDTNNPVPKPEAPEGIRSIAPSSVSIPQGAATPPSAEEQAAPPEKIALFHAFFAQPLSVYGRVVDKAGQPIEGAKIRFGVHDNPNGNGSEYFRTSDTDGRFEISGLQGAAINTEVFKEGYYNGRESRRILKPGERFSKDTPAIFILYKKLDAVPVIYRQSDAITLPEQGAIAHLDFKRGLLLKPEEGEGAMRVEIAATPGTERGRYWRYAISIPEGGLQQRTHEFAFIAPETGYTETISGEYGGPNASNQEWRNSYSGEYFAVLPDGTKAMFKIELGAKRGTYVRVSQLVYNPNPNSRNLEYDPTKIISADR